MARVQFTTAASMDFSLCHPVHICFRAQPAAYPLNTGSFFTHRAKWLMLEAIATVKNIYIFLPSHP
jgi:hypothetical protein